MESQKKQQVDVADLLKSIMMIDEKKASEWLCVVRDGDSNDVHISRASDAVLGTLIRLFCARYVTTSVRHIEYFAGLVTAAYDNTIEQYKRWQRVANIVAYLMHNPRKTRTIHVYPGLKSPIMEIDESQPEMLQCGISKNKLIKSYDKYVRELAQTDETIIADCTRSWLLSDPLSPSAYTDTLFMLEHFLMKRDAKNSFRLCAYLVTACPDLRTDTLKDAFECAWKVLLMCLDSSNPTADVPRYIRACRELFFRSLPHKKKVRICRMSMLYYAILVFCEGKTKASYKEDPVTHTILNLPVTVHESMSYLTLFPRLP